MPSKNSLPQTDDLNQFRLELYRRSMFYHLTKQVEYLRQELARTEEMLADQAIGGLVDALEGEPQC